jgi:hypothetical protein
MRDLQDHLKQGRLSIFELGVYQIIHWQADFKTGVWWGSAPAVHCVAPRGCKLRDVQRAIARLKRIGFLRPREQKQGKRGNFPVLIDKYEPLSGALRGTRLNAARSADWRNPVYEPCTDGDAQHDTVQDPQSAPIHNAVSNKQDAGQRPAAKNTPPVDPRFQPFVDFAFESYKVKHGRKPLWLGKDFSSLKRLLKWQSANLLSMERLTALWRNFVDSSETFILKQGDSLAYFCSNIDKFSDGPIPATPQKGPNGKPTATDLAIRNARALGLDRPN